MTLTIHIASLSAPAMVLVQDLRLQVPAGVIHTLMGPSGCGKSSVLAAVCGTLPLGMAFEGQVDLHGTRIDLLSTQARRVGILFQEDLLFAHMTVHENLLFAVPAGPRPCRDALVRKALEDVEMASFIHANPATLSGGQRTRIALARALLAQPQALLLDEPFSKLDVPLRVRMRELVGGLVRQRGIPALMVTHDPADIADASHVTHLTSARSSP